MFPAKKLECSSSLYLLTHARTVDSLSFLLGNCGSTLRIAFVTPISIAYLAILAFSVAENDSYWPQQLLLPILSSSRVRLTPLLAACIAEDGTLVDNSPKGSGREKCYSFLKCLKRAMWLLLILITICHTHSQIFCVSICHAHNCQKLARDIFMIELIREICKNLAMRMFPDIRYLLA